MKKCIVLIVCMLGLLSCKSVPVDVTPAILLNVEIEDFIKLDGVASLEIENKVFEIGNIVTSGINSDGIEYYFCSTQEHNKQLLMVVNTKLQKVQWCEYYTEYSYFDSEELIAFVVEPFEDRHQSVIMEVHDFSIDFFDTQEFDFAFGKGGIEGDRQFYYLKPVYVLSEGEYSMYEIEWTQANLCYFRTYYTLFSGKQGRGTELDEGGRDPEPIDELQPLEVIPTWKSPFGYVTVAENENDQYSVSFIIPEGSELSWENCEIMNTDKKTGKFDKIPFSSIFEYQDPLVSITPAKNKDNRIAFIVDTKEFPYDFYFDPVGDTTDIFLRPSSFVRLYPR